MKKNTILHIQHWAKGPDSPSDWSRAVIVTPDGKACIIAEYPSPMPVTAYIYGFQVEEDMRQLGLGTQLLNEMHAHLRVAGMKYVQLLWEAKDMMPWVKNWYIKQGYKIIYNEPGVKTLLRLIL